MKTMKQLLPILLLIVQIFVARLAVAQAPQAIPYQAIARDLTGATLVNQSISLRISIHDISASGTVVYQETHSATTNALGLFNLNIGQGTATIGTLPTVNWTNGSKFIQVEMDPAGGNNYSDMGTNQLMSVPYALHAGSTTETDPQVGALTSNSVPKWNGTSLENGSIMDNGNVGIGTTTPAAKLDVAGDARINGIKIGRSGGNDLSNTAVGFNSLINNTTGLDNTSVGHESMAGNSTGDDNTAVGFRALSGNSSGPGNTALGAYALESNTTARWNTAIGGSALRVNNGWDNTAIGVNALGSNTTGESNAATGMFSMAQNTTGSGNTANGRESLLQNQTGIGNSAFGQSALHDNIGGNLNSAIGYEAFYTNAGSLNTALGAKTTIGNNGVLDNATAVGAFARVDASNSIVLGSIAGVNSAASSTNVGIGTTTPAARLDVAGNVKIADGTQGAGKVLTSDANGLASWQTNTATGPQGPAGTNGLDGKTVLNGTSNPTSVVGTNGDFYINTTTKQIFGPKTSGTWAAGTSLVGPAGATGATGATGPQGPAGSNGTNGLDGKTVLNGTVNPAAATGNNGDFYINTSTNQIFGPKTAGAWGAGISLVGPQGPAGTVGWGLTGNSGTTSANFIGTTDNKHLRLRTNNTERVVIDSSGRVGIGTTSPNSKLHLNDIVSDNLDMEMTGSASKILFRTYSNAVTWPLNLRGGVGLFNGTGNGNLNIGTFGTGRVNIYSNNFFNNPALSVGTTDVGIGTTVPAAKLNVAQDLTMDGDIINGQLMVSGASSTSKRLLMGYDVNGNGFGYIKSAHYGVTWTPLCLQPTGGNYAPVGIGTTTPFCKLHTNFDAGLGTTVPSSGNTDGHTGFRLHSNVVAIDMGILQNGVSYLQNRNHQDFSTTYPFLINPVGGDVAIGTQTLASGYKLTVGGKVICTELRVQAMPFPDYVFSPEYKLTPLEEVEQHINTHHRLPNMPPAAEVEAEGMNVGGVQLKLVEKVEELTLYLLQQQKELKAQQEEIMKLKAQIDHSKN